MAELRMRTKDAHMRQARVGDNRSCAISAPGCRVRRRTADPGALNRERRRLKSTRSRTATSAPEYLDVDVHGITPARGTTTSSPAQIDNESNLRSPLSAGTEPDRRKVCSTHRQIHPDRGNSNIIRHGCCGDLLRPSQKTPGQARTVSPPQSRWKQYCCEVTSGSICWSTRADSAPAWAQQF